jgi:hypothetical protein
MKLFLINELHSKLVYLHCSRNCAKLTDAKRLSYSAKSSFLVKNICIIIIQILFSKKFKQLIIPLKAIIVENKYICLPFDNGSYAIQCIFSVSWFSVVSIHLWETNVKSNCWNHVIIAIAFILGCRPIAQKAQVCYKWKPFLYLFKREFLSQIFLQLHIYF